MLREKKLQLPRLQVKSAAGTAGSLKHLTFCEFYNRLLYIKTSPSLRRDALFPRKTRGKGEGREEKRHRNFARRGSHTKMPTR